MIVYKTYLKIIKTMLPVILIFCGIFLGISLLNYSMGGSSSFDNSFSSKKMKIAIFDNDKSIISKDLSNYILESNIQVNLNDTLKNKKDALFNRSVEYILTIPKGFQEDIINKNKIEVEKMEIPGSYSGYFVDQIVNKYIELFKIEKINYNKINDDNVNSILDSIKNILKEQVNVTITDNKLKSTDDKKFASILNFSTYILIGLIISIIGMLNVSFNDEHIKARTMVSPTSETKILKTQIICCGVVCIGIVLLQYVVTIIIDYKKALSLRGCLALINMFVFGIVVLSLAYLISSIIKSKNAQSAAANVIGLGMSFLCGAFVPLEMLGTGTKRLGKCLPAYYFIECNNKIFNQITITKEIIKDIFKYYAIELAFALVFFMIVVVLKKRKNNL